MSHNVLRPRAVVFEEHCRANIRRMAKKATRMGAAFTPHFKTHQSAIIGNWFRDEGVSTITVSSPEMAFYFAEHNWETITIAFPFFRGQAGLIRKLCKMCNLQLFITSPEDVIFLDEEIEHPIRLFIEVDAGYGRSGIRPDEVGTISAIMKAADQSTNLSFSGFYVHDGATYQVQGKKAVSNIIQRDLDAFQLLQKTYPGRNLDYCLGDTPSSSLCDDLHPANCFSPGNLVFYDLMQKQIGSCSWNDIGLLIRVPVAQEKPGTDQCIIHGGAVHFSKDRILIDGLQTFGQPVVVNEDHTISPIAGSRVSALSQEHGTVEGLNALRNAYGADKLQELWICPVHSCLTANLFETYHTPDGKLLTKRILS